MANKTSAVADEPIEVLFALHPKFNLMDFAGPVEVLTSCLHDAKDPSEWPQPRLCYQPRTCSSVPPKLGGQCPDGAGGHCSGTSNGITL